MAASYRVHVLRLIAGFRGESRVVVKPKGGVARLFQPS
jgi:hypothetical protein